jgi:hypothetical protein
LITWAVRAPNLDSVHRSAAQHGIALGGVLSGSRTRPDGTVLSWTFTDPGTMVGDGLVPFFLDWAPGSAHPAGTAVKGATLVALRGEHPDVPRVRTMLDQLGLALPLGRAADPALVAVVDSPRGRVELR